MKSTKIVVDKATGETSQQDVFLERTRATARAPTWLACRV